MKKLLFPASIVLAILGCGGDMDDNMPCLTCKEAYPSVQSSSSYILSSSSLGESSSSSVPGSSSLDESSSSSVPSSSSLDEIDESSSSSIPSSSSLDEIDESSSSSVPSSSSSEEISSSSIQCSADSGTFTDSRDSKTYSYIKICYQTWMAENLNYNPNTSSSSSSGNSVCYNNEASNCTAYGRLYNYSTAITICPEGWHTPSNEEWDELFRYIDGTSGTSSPYESPTAAKHLKAATGWYNCGPSGSGSSYLCEDTHGFSALPGGFGDNGGYSFGNAERLGYWWSATYNGNNGNGGNGNAYYLTMLSSNERILWRSDSKSNLFSVRCLKD